MVNCPIVVQAGSLTMGRSPTVVRIKEYVGKLAHGEEV